MKRYREDPKIFCGECYWKGTESELLTAPNPFDPGDEIYGCPNCKGVDCCEHACDCPGCWHPVSAGTPTEKGYVYTCLKHTAEEVING